MIPYTGRDGAIVFGVYVVTCEAEVTLTARLRSIRISSWKDPDSDLPVLVQTMKEYEQWK